MTTKPILVADLFCGAGGATEAALRSMRALGLTCNHFLAVNHWPTAIETQSLNHPQIRHLCEALEAVNPRAQVPGGRLQLLIAAPECTFFSTARGGRPVTDQQRTQPWVILKWLQELYVENLLIENVPEFRNWGPIGANGKPLKSMRGATYRAFLETIRSLGYIVEDRILNAADYGDPTTRRRLFIIAKRGTKPITWPVPTHSQGGGRTLFGRTEKWRAAREVIDWSLEGQSIFGRKKPLSPKTMARIIAGLQRFGGDDIKPFLVILRNHADARSVDEPVPTLAAQGQHIALCEPKPFVMHVTHGSDSSKRERSLDDPLPTITGAHRGELAVCEPFLVVNNEHNAPKSLDEPVPTVTGGDRLYKCDAFVLQQQSGGVPRAVDDPLPTIATDGAISLVEPFMVSVAHGDNPEGSGRGNGGRVRSIEDPMPAVTASGNDYAVVEPFIVPPRGFSDGPVDSVDRPLRTIVAASGHTFAVVEPFLIPHYGERDGQVPRTHSMDEPVPTIPASGDGKFEVVQPFLVSAGGPRVGPQSTDAPMNTVLTRDHMAVVQPFIVGTGGPERAGKPKSVDDPLGTVMTREHKALVEPIIASYYGTKNISPVSAPLPTITTKDRFALVMPVVNGRALDIRLRMLKPHELAAAMSFGADYQFAGNQGDKVKQIGNAWPVRVGQALITAILEQYAVARPKRLEAIA